MKAEIRELTNEEYHACEGISASAIKVLLKCPQIFHYKYILGNRDEETKAMRIGTALHTLILEPHLFLNNHAILDSVPRKGSKNYDAMMDLCGDKTWVHKDEHAELLEMAKSLKAYEKFDLIFSRDGKAEQSIFWEDEDTGILLKSRPDFINYKVEIIFDLKTASDASRSEFSKSKMNYGTYIQAYMQQAAVEAITGKKCPVVHVVVEKNAPYPVACYQVTEAELGMGEFQLKKALQYYSDCERIGRWRGYTTHTEWMAAGGKEQIQELPLPGWAENKFNNEGLINE